MKEGFDSQVKIYNNVILCKLNDFNKFFLTTDWPPWSVTNHVVDPKPTPNYEHTTKFEGLLPSVGSQHGI